MPNLSDVISAVEQTDSDFQKGLSQTSQDKDAAATIQAKLDAANQVISDDLVAQNAKAAARNAALKAASDAFLEAITPVDPPPVPVQS